MNVSLHTDQGYTTLRNDLTDLGIQRFQQVVEQGKCLPECELVTYVNARNLPACAALESKGFRIEKYHYRMQIDMDGIYPDPPLPEGFSLSTYTEQNKRELFDLIVDAFDWEGRQLFDCETWQKNVLRGGRFNPEYFILLRQADRLVGAALCYDEEGRAWLKELAVAADLRGRGLGSLLLKHVFHVFSQKGTSTVALGVVSTNPKAAAIYEHAGMTRTREFIQYQQGV